MLKTIINLNKALVKYNKIILFTYIYTYFTVFSLFVGKGYFYSNLKPFLIFNILTVSFYKKQVYIFI